MKRLILLVIVSFIFNSSSCESDCYNCLDAYARVNAADGSDVLAATEIPFRSVVNVESSLEVWNWQPIEGMDTIYLPYFEYIVLPINPEEEKSTFDFRDENGKTLGSIVLSPTFSLKYNNACEDFRLQVEGETNIEINFEDINVYVNTLTNSYPSCFPFLEIQL